MRGGYGVNGTHKIFRELARDFSRQGFTAFRYNKRGASFEHLDDGLTIFDNPTQNAPKKKARLRIIRKAKKMLD